MHAQQLLSQRMGCRCLHTLWLDLTCLLWLLGRCCRYDFTDGDLNVSLAQLQEYLDSYETPPFRWALEQHG